MTNDKSLSGLAELGRPKVPPPLDPGFRPAALCRRSFQAAVRAEGGVPVILALERNDGQTAVYRTAVFPSGSPRAVLNQAYLERTIKFLLWQKGGWRITLSAPPELVAALQRIYAPDGERAFDNGFMAGVYERSFSLEGREEAALPAGNERASSLGGHLDGCRIGFDLGASDRKVAAVIDGRVVWSEEVVWQPKLHDDPAYHYHQIQAALHHAASYLPRVDAIGGSSAGIYVNNRVMVASLFRAVPPALFHAQVRELFVRLGREWGIPLEVINDGEVTALAGSIALNDGAVLGVAMGSSEAAGYVTPERQITTGLNELAFAPVDYNPEAPTDEWSGDRGCGVQYFSQEAVIRLAPAAGLALPEATPAEKLRFVQDALAGGDERARAVFQTIGCYLGYAIAHYAEFYDLRHLLILGRVTSGEGGALILRGAQEVIGREFPDLAQIQLHLPEEETERRHGQAIAAASLPGA